MTKGKGNKNNGVVGIVNGSMSTVKAAAKVKNVTRRRHFMSAKAEATSSTQVLSASQSPHPVGSQYSAGTLLFAASELSVSAREWIQKHDKYRMTNVEVFVTLASRSKNGSVDRTAPVELYFYEDTDADAATQTSWIRTSDRDNLGRVILNAFHPSQRLITFKPTPSYLTQGGQTATPFNVVPNKNTWLDALALDQLYASLRFFSCCPQTDSSGQSYEYSLHFSSRITIEATQPI